MAVNKYMKKYIDAIQFFGMHGNVGDAVLLIESKPSESQLANAIAYAVSKGQNADDAKRHADVIKEHWEWLDKANSDVGMNI